MLNIIERTVLEALLEHEPTVSLVPGRSLDDVTIASRDWTGVGFFSEFRESYVCGPESYNGPASEIGMGFHGRLNDTTDFGILTYFKDGRLTDLEGYTYGEPWPETVETVTCRWGPFTRF